MVDFATMVFSAQSGGVYFPTLLPKIYNEKNGPDAMPYHYLVRENGIIKACVMSYPLELEVAGSRLTGYGIGTVSVHPRARSRGFMRALMWEAIGEMERENVDFSVLGGQRQRYGYYGYERTGEDLSFHFHRTNLRHTCGSLEIDGIAMRQVTPDDREALDWIALCAQSRPLHAKRDRQRLYDILCSWENRPYFFTYHGAAMGYLLAHGKSIAEVDLADSLPLTQPLERMLKQYLTQTGLLGVDIQIPRYRSDLIRILDGICEYNRLGSGENVKIFHFDRVIEAFLRLKNQMIPLSHGTVLMEIRGIGVLEITVDGQGVRVRSLAAGMGAQPHLSLEPMEAQRLLTQSVAQYTGMGGSIPARNRDWFPLPFWFPHVDNV